ncbi:Uncharacterised protein [Mycolicibacterium vanbaalenii]|uniref:GAF domain-containing protein n=1 Tax=Mycolicibacterium vanbaalenii TaxID=110539 RepID=A0A5S9R4C4_MYCVN|nr:Uncharacterised protein [Mycolicibacterium vanbaalenii]
MVNKSVNKFDDWLNARLERCAGDANEDVHTYVARAVASRMLVDVRRTDQPVLRDLMAHLLDSKVLGETDMPGVEAAITDPDRLEALQATGLLDSGQDAVLDRITSALAQALDVPFAAVTLVDADRLLLKSVKTTTPDNFGGGQVPLEWSICQYTVAQGSTLALDDARIDPVFKLHPAVAAGTFVAYLGVPVKDRKGNAIGTLCVSDTKPRMWTAGHVQILSDFTALAAERAFGYAP